MAPIRLGPNTSSLAAQHDLSDATSALALSYQRLSSGLRINQASDDAAGLALADQLNSDSRVYAQGARNVSDGLSLTSIAQSALTAIRDIAQRQLELAQQASNGTLTSTQRAALNTEAAALTTEFATIVSSTTFNGINIFSSTATTLYIQAGYGQNGKVPVPLVNLQGSSQANGTFQSAQNIATGGNAPAWVALGDFNGDGKQDIASADFSGGDISILISNGDGTFKAPLTLPAAGGASLNSLAIADVNGDGNLDVISTEVGNAAQVFLGNGNGTFQSVLSFATGGSTPFAVSVADVNGDGKMDLVTTDHGGNDISVLLGNGNGTFQAAHTFQSGGTGPQKIALVDLNGDNKLDVVISDQIGDISVFLGNGNGTFQAAHTFQTGDAGTFSLAAGDVNGDGKIDVVTGNYYGGDVSVLLGNSDGTFGTAITYHTGAGSPRSIILADLNSDGALDIAAANFDTGAISVFTNNGNGTFGAAKSYATGATHPQSLTFGDLNGDGISDIITANNGSNNLSLFFGNGSVGILPPTINLSTQLSAQEAVTTMTSSIALIDGQLGTIGAASSRLHAVLDTMQIQSENYRAAAARVENIDVAEELAKTLSGQIRLQAASAILAQANTEASVVLKLLG